MDTFPIRYCTGGCRTAHHAHLYTTDPVDGVLDRPYLCPGNLNEAREWLDDETGQRTGQGFISPIPPP